MKRILVNSVAARLGGGQTYIKNLLSLEHFEGIDRIFILKPEKLEIPEHDQVVLIPVAEKNIKSPFIRVIWENIAIKKLIREHQIDTYFCPGGSLNYVPGTIDGRAIKSVVTFQNMLPLDDVQVRKYGLTKMRIRNILLKKVFKKSMQTADLVIFTSKYALSRAMLLCKNKIKHHVLIPNGISAKLENIETEKPFSCPNDPYLLYVSTIDVYKSQKEVITAFALLRERSDFNYKLVLLGESYLPYREEVDSLIRKLGLVDRVIFPGLVDSNELKRLYANATINIFASQTENCPFTLLEAMASGRPVVSSNMQPMPELAENTVIYFDPRDPENLVLAINKYLDNPNLMEQLPIRAGIKVSEFDLNKMVLDTWNAVVSS